LLALVNFAVSQRCSECGDNPWDEEPNFFGMGMA